VWADNFRKIGERLTALEAERRPLAGQKHRSTEENRRLDAVKKKLEVTQADFEKMLNQLVVDASTPKALSEQLRELKEVGALRAALGALGPGTVAIYTLVGETKYRVIFVTADALVAGEYDISAADLCRRVEDFRKALQDVDSNPLPLATNLYRILIGPIEGSLRAAGAKTLMWSLDGPLRYVPMAALHDGTNYLVQSYKNVVFTPANLMQLKEASSRGWIGLGLGVSRAHPGFSALPSVPGELRGIIGEKGVPAAGAVMPGTVKLDENFTLESMLDALHDKYPLVHIATHFKLNPGNAKDSLLLLGDGSGLTLANLKELPEVFAGVELLTLSACNTAYGGSSASGGEVDGLGEIAQMKGAKAVMATLWSVRDVSTSKLMEEFYRLRQAGAGKTKAEALQEAQLEMMGKLAKPEGAGPGASNFGGNGEKKPDPVVFEFDPRRPFAHPHFWAPFIVMGNWK
jgi:CHAT domain-containing protein